MDAALGSCSLAAAQDPDGKGRLWLVGCGLLAVEACWLWAWAWGSGLLSEAFESLFERLGILALNAVLGLMSPLLPLSLGTFVCVCVLERVARVCV